MAKSIIRMKFELSFCGKSYSSAFLFQILMRKMVNNFFAYVWFLTFPSREMLSTILTYFVFQVNVSSETTASFLLSMSVSAAHYIWRAMRKKTVIFSCPAIVTVCRLQFLTFVLSLVITLHLCLISFEISCFNTNFSKNVSIVVNNINCTFSKNAILSGLKCFLRTFLCFTNFILIPLNVVVSLGIQTYFSRWNSDRFVPWCYSPVFHYRRKLP